jgi:integral membrane protein
MNTTLLQTPIGRLRVIGLLEGLSFLLLLGIAMPLKYYADMPLAVKYTGWAHGLLFVLYMGAVAQAALEHKWSVLKTIMAVIASLLPFGPFVLDVQLKKEQAQLEASGKKVEA